MKFNRFFTKYFSDKKKKGYNAFINLEPPFPFFT